MENNLDVITDVFYQKGYSVTEDFFSHSQIDEILKKINLLREEDAFHRAGIGNKKDFQRDESIRNDFVYWLNADDSFFKSIFFSKIEELMLLLNRRCFLGLNDFEFHLAYYGPGNFYKKHRDAFRNDDARKVTVICYLNKNWKSDHGGELILYPENEPELIINPTGGKLVVFESRLEHEVLPSKADRYSITGWLKNKSRLI